MIDITLPLRTKNPTNNRKHWRTVHTRSKKERWTTCLMVQAAMKKSIDLIPCRTPFPITLTRLSAGELDSDNLRAALKSIRDGVADAFGTDDSSTSMLRFEYAQERCKRGTFGVRVEIA